MKRNYAIIGFSVFIVGIFTGATINQSDQNQNGNFTRAQEAAQSFMGQLQGVLMKELREGGPVQALAVCADTAQQLTQHAAEHLGVSIKRTSDRVRNTMNAPDEYEKRILEKFSVMHSEEQEPPFIYTEERTIDGKKEFWYIQSIHVQAQCLGCHGDDETIAANVKKLLHDRYPRDTATGYRPGDFRGAIRVSFQINQ
jgi:hypothetical protein